MQKSRQNIALRLRRATWALRQQRLSSAQNFALEALESRRLLSSSASALSTVVTLPLNVSPLSTAAPTGISPSTIRHAYGIDQITFPGGLVGDGSGQTIAIVDPMDSPGLVSSSDPAFITSDLHRFDQQFGLPDPNFTKIVVGGFASPDAGWSAEISLDVEWAHVVAPKANIILVETAQSSVGSLITAINAATAIPSVTVVSMSWGQPDSGSESTFENALVTPAGHQGITFISGSGDSGSPGTYPGASPHVISVGGTTLALSGNNYASETGWSGSGGGISDFPKPTYQSGIVLSSTHRAFPDVAFDADPASGVPVYDSYLSKSKPWVNLAGTSLSSPAWAGLIAIADQALTAQGAGSLDGYSQTLPLLYQLPASDFHDITSGTNGNAAGAGYDLVTGLGSPVANVLIPDLVQAADTSLHVIATTPTAGSSNFGTAQLNFTITFSSGVDPSTVQLSKFTINGIAPQSINFDNNNTISTLQYSFSPVSSAGGQTISIAAGAVDRASDETGNIAFSAKFIAATQPLQVGISLPANAIKGQGMIVGTITTALPVNQDLYITLSSSNPAKLSVPATVLLPAGQTSANFNATVQQDNIIDFTQTVTVTASYDNWVSGGTAVSIIDDNTTLSMSLPPPEWEGQTIADGGTISLGGITSVGVLVQLSSSFPAELTVPASVYIPAGQKSANFDITLINDGIAHPPRSISITASAPQMAGTVGVLSVHDSNIAGVYFYPVVATQTAGVTFRVNATAVNASGELLGSYQGPFTLSAIGANGAEPVSPSGGFFINGAWNGYVTLANVDSATKLTLTSAGFSITSNAINVMSASTPAIVKKAVVQPTSVVVATQGSTMSTITTQTAFATSPTTNSPITFSPSASPTIVAPISSPMVTVAIPPHAVVFGPFPPAFFSARVAIPAPITTIATLPKVSATPSKPAKVNVPVRRATTRALFANNAMRGNKSNVFYTISSPSDSKVSKILHA